VGRAAVRDEWRDARAMPVEAEEHEQVRRALSVSEREIGALPGARLDRKQSYSPRYLKDIVYRSVRGLGMLGARGCGCRV
jgi:hypothetical protein